MTPSARAAIITRRTYNRPIPGTNPEVFETWEQTVDRVISHQRWLWERARRGRRLGQHGEVELEALRQIMLNRQGAVAGRTLWLRGTDIARRREASQFNCVYAAQETVHDVVDSLWLLLQGVGVGFMPRVGALNGFARPIHDIRVVRSIRTEKGGKETNSEAWDAENRTWTITVGDSAEAWAKSVGKLLAGKYPAETLILDFSELRPAGIRLNGYGWISSGDQAISVAYMAIARILSRRAGGLLSKHDIHDILNWLGTILSSRRSSEIALYPYGANGWETFATFKKDFWLHNNEHRQQSNNSLIFWSKPSKSQLRDLFDMIVDAGGSEPGFINGEGIQGFHA